MLLLMPLVGCIETAKAPPTEPPLIEPTVSDQPDTAVRKTVLQQAKASAAADSDWPALFNQNRRSVTDASINPVWPDDGPPLVWEVEVGTGYGSPVTANEKVVFNHRVGDEEMVQCHDVATGELLWKHSYPTTAVCDFEYSDGPYSTPIIDPVTERVYNVGGQAQMQCLNLETGDLIWARHLHQDYDVQSDIFPVGASALLDKSSRNHPGGQLLFNPGAFDQNAGIVSIDAFTGKTLWEATDHGPGYGTPLVVALHEQRFGFMLTDEGLVCLDPDSGQVDWEIEYRRRGDLTRNATSPAAYGDHVVVVCSGLGAMSVKILPDRSYEQAWRQRRTIDSQYNPLITDEHHLYSFTSAGQGGAKFRCIDLSDGEMQWTYHSVLKRGMGFATPDAIILLGERGHLASLLRTPEKPTVISFTKEPIMTEPCYCSPAIHGNLLVLKDEQRIAVFGCSY